MATPNIINVATITPKVAVGAVTTSRADIVDVPAENCAKINTYDCKHRWYKCC